VALRVFFKGGFKIDIFSKSGALGDQARALLLSELKREADTRFRRSKEAMRNAVEVECRKPYVVAETETSTSVPDSLTVVVPR
jgi:hypothetical protein